MTGNDQSDSDVPTKPSILVSRRFRWAAGSLAVVCVVAVVVGATVLCGPDRADHGRTRAGGSQAPSGALDSPQPSGEASTGAMSPAPSQAPSQSTAARSNRANCGPNPSACGFPDATNTGVPRGVQLTVVNGNITVTRAGTVIDGKDIRGCVNVEAPNVTIRKSKVTCADYFVIASFAERYQGGGLRIEDVEIDCGNHNSTGIGSYGFVARRVQAHNCENGFDIDRDAKVIDSYIHSPYEGELGHGDGIQFSPGAGSNVTISHNTIFSPQATSSVISNAADLVNITVSGNLFAGGSYSLYCPDHSRNYRANDNRFSTVYSSKGGAYGPWVNCDKIAEFRGNIWDKDLKPVPVTGYY